MSDDNIVQLIQPGSFSDPLTEVLRNGARSMLAKAVEAEVAASVILPPYARRSRSLEVLIPILYLKGVSTGDFEEALAALLGKDAPGLSPSTIARLKETWIEEHARWKKRDLSARRYVYVWADGVHVQARLEDEKQCILVLIGATPEGKKELHGLKVVLGVKLSAWEAFAHLFALGVEFVEIASCFSFSDGVLHPLPRS